MTQKQEIELFIWLKKIAPGCEFHHGDCVGSDKRAAFLAHDAGLRLFEHPPTNRSKRAYVSSFLESTKLPPKPYLERNHDIVDASDALFATPNTMEEVMRSGTWATIRYARKRLKPIIIIWPDGTVTEENNGKRIDPS